MIDVQSIPMRASRLRGGYGSPGQAWCAYAASVLLHASVVIGAMQWSFDPTDTPTLARPQFREGEHASQVTIRLVLPAEDEQPIVLKPKLVRRSQAPPPQPQALPPTQAAKQATSAQLSVEPVVALLASDKGLPPIKPQESATSIVPPAPPDAQLASKTQFEAPLSPAPESVAAPQVSIAQQFTVEFTPPVPQPQEVQAPAANTTAPAGVRRGVAVKDLPTPVYPPLSRRLGEEGMVKVEIEVLADGRVGDIRVVQRRGSDRFVDAVFDALRRARFEPAVLDGRPVRDVVTIPFEFVLR